MFLHFRAECGMIQKNVSTKPPGNGGRKEVRYMAKKEDKAPKKPKEPKPPKEKKKKYPKTIGEILLPLLVILLVFVGIADLLLAAYIGYWFLSAELQGTPGISAGSLAPSQTADRTDNLIDAVDLGAWFQDN